jgi:hypothetical protein
MAIPASPRQLVNLFHQLFRHYMDNSSSTCLKNIPVTFVTGMKIAIRPKRVIKGQKETNLEIRSSSG